MKKTIVLIMLLGSLFRTCFAASTPDPKLNGFDIQMLDQEDLVFGKIEIDLNGSSSFFSYSSTKNVLPAMAILLNTKNILKWFKAGHFDDSRGWDTLASSYAPDSVEKMYSFILARKTNLIDSELDRQILFAQGIKDFSTLGCVTSFRSTFERGAASEERIQKSKECLAVLDPSGKQNFISGWFKSFVEACSEDKTCAKNDISKKLLAS